MAATGRTFTPEAAHGGEVPVAETTALVMIEFQNEFVTEGGKLHDAVKGVMEETGMLGKAVEVCAFARARGMKVIHAPISFKEDMSNNPNKGLGILKGCNDGKLFVADTWNSKICDEMTPAEGDLEVIGKTGLDAFPGSNLETLLVENNITTIVLGGLLTNCCVESTMRTAFEKGFHVITLTDCCAATSSEGHSAATAGTFGMFSAPMTKDEFVGMWPATV